MCHLVVTCIGGDHHHLVLTVYRGNTGHTQTHVYSSIVVCVCYTRYEEGYLQCEPYNTGAAGALIVQRTVKGSRLHPTAIAHKKHFDGSTQTLGNEPTGHQTSFTARCGTSTTAMAKCGPGGHLWPFTIYLWPQSFTFSSV